MKKFKSLLIKREHIKKHLVHINKYAPRTVKRKKATLKVFYSHLLYEDCISENPFDKIRINIRVQKSLPSVLSLIEVTATLKQLQSQNEISTNRPKYRHCRVVIRHWNSCFRTLFSQKVKHTFHFSIIKILGKGNKERIIPIT